MTLSAKSIGMVSVVLPTCQAVGAAQRTTMRLHSDFESFVARDHRRLVDSPTDFSGTMLWHQGERIGYEDKIIDENNVTVPHESTTEWTKAYEHDKYWGTQRGWSYTKDDQDLVVTSTEWKPDNPNDTGTMFRFRTNETKRFNVVNDEGEQVMVSDTHKNPFYDVHKSQSENAFDQAHIVKTQLDTDVDSFYIAMDNAQSASDTQYHFIDNGDGQMNIHDLHHVNGTLKVEDLENMKQGLTSDHLHVEYDLDFFNDAIEQAREIQVPIHERFHKITVNSDGNEYVFQDLNADGIITIDDLVSVKGDEITLVDLFNETPLKGGLDAVEIAGIVSGSVTFLVIAGVLAHYCYKQRCQPKIDG